MVLSIADVGSKRSIGDRGTVSAKAAFLHHMTHNISKHPTLFGFSGTLSQEICILFPGCFQHLSLVYMALSYNTLRTWDNCQYLL